ncbi:hypothetical protein ACFOOP_19425 [Marinicaulis aureus]|uniref:Lipocalin-like domain-containing protein n=1 Tax=Hyphococcus aureus TaxID=2666033 RepID=A0ABW1KZ76_9PROT
MKQAYAIVLMLVLAVACKPAQSPQSADEDSWASALGSGVDDAYEAPEYRAFDFWIGEWEANWRSQPEGEFYHEKEGSWTRQRVFPVLGGKALIELAWARDNPEAPSQRGFSIRYYDSARERWVMAQNWPNGQNQGGAFTDQLIGEEHLGRLTMYSLAERPQPDGSLSVAHRRYNFTDIRPGVSFRWDGSNTRDGGATWLTWNVVDFLRLRDLNTFGDAGTDFPGVHKKTLCTEEPHGAMDGLAGDWRGVRRDADGVETPVRFSAGLVLDGCGVLAALETQNRREILAVGYYDRFEKWVIFRLDDQPGTTHSYFVSDVAGDGAVFAEADKLAIVDEFAPYLREESFEAASAHRRLMFERIGEQELVLREENRSGDAESWSLKAEYHLTRR